MNRWLGLALLLMTAGLFLVANRGAYKGYFQDDELDNISWAPQVPLTEFAKTLATPRFLTQNFRPVGHFFFYAAGRAFGLDFPKYVIPLHLLHFLNVWLVWLLARRLGLSPLAAASGTLFFAFHIAVFDAYWKPMYVFDVLCGTFCLLSLLLYTHGRLVWSFLAFWLAYKSKELAVMLPAVMACYELWLGKRRWKPLVPFFLVSLSFGLQGLIFNPNKDNDYTFRFTLAALATTSVFYAGKLFLVPYGGFVLPAVPFFVRDRRVWFGLGTMGLFFLPLAFLPGRLFGAYCYVPLIGLALALGALAEFASWKLVTALFLLWIPWNYLHLRLDRKRTLAIARDNRSYVTALAEFAPGAPDIHTFIYDGRPAALNVWGIHGALQYLYHRGDLRVLSLDDPEGKAALNEPSLALLTWDPTRGKLSVVARRRGVADASFIRMDGGTPVWQLGAGWYPLEAGFRWIQPEATARLQRPAGARQFEFTVNIGPDLIRDLGHTEVRVLLDGKPLLRQVFVRPGWQSVRWTLPPADPGPVQVTFQVQPAYHPATDPRTLGIAIASFGFLVEEPS